MMAGESLILQKKRHRQIAGNSDLVESSNYFMHRKRALHYFHAYLASPSSNAEAVRLKFLQVVSVGVLMRFILNPIKVFRTSVFDSLLLTSFFIYNNSVQAQQRACVMTDRSTTVCGKLIRQTQSSTNKSVQSFGQKDEVGNFVYVLKDCKRLSANLNKGKETLKASYASAFELVGSNGKSYKGSVFSFGGQEGNYATATLSTGVNYLAEITFEEVPTQITQFPLLRGTFNELGQNQVHFRNIIISN
jgi:hypothetical protein